ncbi:BlaI/MecI/CopY family transcriptional regulator [Alkaliphilus crotonatoxidans]
MKAITPSENEWLIMELFWQTNRSMTSAEVIETLQKKKDISKKTVRVMINRLCQKNILDYTIDEKDSRIYHYFPVKTKEECLKGKSQHFIESYFSGNGADAVATLMQTLTLTEEQIQEISEILEKSKEQEK